MCQDLGQVLYMPFFCFLLCLSLHNLKNIFGKKWTYGRNLEQGLHKNNSYVRVHHFTIFFTLEYAATPTCEKRPSPGLLQLSPKLLKHQSWPSGAEQQRSHFGLAHCFCTIASMSCLPLSNWLLFLKCSFSYLQQPLPDWLKLELLVSSDDLFNTIKKLEIINPSFKKIGPEKLVAPGYPPRGQLRQDWNLELPDFWCSTFRMTCVLSLVCIVQ